MQNDSHHHTAIDDVLRQKELLSGYESIRRGSAFDYDIAERNWNYERGRQLAICVRQVLGYIPPMPGGIELVRPTYIALRLDGTLLPTEVTPAMRSHYADSQGKFSPAKYAAVHIPQANSSAPSFVDSLF